MKRREFIKSTATGSAFLLTSGSPPFQWLPEIYNLSNYCRQSERKIPVAYRVDVVVAGGSTAAVAAAISAAKAGASVFLVAMEPYLGEDVCGTYRYWAEKSEVTRTELGNKLFGQGLPTPLHVKKTLDNELINLDIPFLYSSYVTDILHDSDGLLAGIVIANRSGRQAVIAKTVVDATPRALVARLAGAYFSSFPAGKHQFKFIAVGNKKKQVSDGSLRELPEKVVVKENSYAAFEYTFLVDMPDSSWASFAAAENQIRDLTWDPDQVDAADLLFQVPPDLIKGKKRWNKGYADPEEIAEEVFQPKNVSGIYVLGGCASMDRKSADAFLQPGNLIRVGERIGEAAAIFASARPENDKAILSGKIIKDALPGDTGELLGGIRRSLNQGEIISEDTVLPVLGEFDTVVLGGGTSGAPAAVGAARHGAKTLVVEYLHGLGGIGTLGMVGRYYHGYREGFTNEVDMGTKAIGEGNPRQKKRLDEWVFDWKTEFYRKEIRKAGGEIWFGVLGCGTFVENGTVKGLVVATPVGKGVVLANTLIDSTGSADAAISAGAGFVYTDGLSVAVQGAGMPYRNPDDFYNNTDWTFTDDTDLLDVWQTFILAKDKFADQYDIGQLPQTRERRRMVGDYTVSVLDVYNGRTYPDTISIHVSSFDTHGFTEDPFFSLKPPEHSGVDVTAYMPFRALLPKGLEGIAVTGLGTSAHRDAMPVLRMQPCLQDQGYSVGWASAIAAFNRQKIRHIDLNSLQIKLVNIKNLPESVLTDKSNFPPSLEEIQQAVLTVTDNLRGLEILLWDADRSVPMLRDALQFSNDEEHRLMYARILGMLGIPDGWADLMKAVDGFDDWDKGWRYTGMGQFGASISYLDSLIIALGRTKKKEAIPSIIRLAEKLTPESEFSHFRAVAIALETIADQSGSPVLFSLLQLSGVRGHSFPDIKTAKKLTPADKVDVSTRNNSLRELILGRALFNCGDYNGLGNQILNEYSKDLRGHYYRHATGVLQKATETKNPNIEL